jgi:hypothetical protein
VLGNALVRKWGRASNRPNPGLSKSVQTIVKAVQKEISLLWEALAYKIIIENNWFTNCVAFCVVCYSRYAMALCVTQMLIATNNCKCNEMKTFCLFN